MNRVGVNRRIAIHIPADPGSEAKEGARDLDRFIQFIDNTKTPFESLMKRRNDPIDHLGQVE